MTPHPFPYQGSKRAIARHILPYFPPGVRCLIEPFCGSGAITIAAATHCLANGFLLSDLNKPLMSLWQEILEKPHELADEYERLWQAQLPDKKEFFLRMRDEFNSLHQPSRLLYLLARIVKGSVRYNSEGKFNQGADNRRLGMRPATMRRQILAVARLLAGKTSIATGDFRDIALQANKEDLLYMDPPYQGTSFTRDHRYYEGVSYDEFVDALMQMNARDISYIVSYDGKTGDKLHGNALPAGLSLEHLYIHAGRSTQATLLGKKHHTIESLYLSPALAERLNDHKAEPIKMPKIPQQETIFA